jgi:hypothetical protein
MEKRSNFYYCLLSCLDEKIKKDISIDFIDYVLQIYQETLLELLMDYDVSAGIGVYSVKTHYNPRKLTGNPYNYIPYFRFYVGSKKRYRSKSSIHNKDKLQIRINNAKKEEDKSNRTQ